MKELKELEWEKVVLQFNVNTATSLFKSLTSALIDLDKKKEYQYLLDRMNKFTRLHG